MKVLARLSLLALATSAVACDGCGTRVSSAGTAPTGTTHTNVDDRDEQAIARLDDQSLLTRARKSAECGVVEPAPCDDPYIVQVRCELALRASHERRLFDALLADARGTDRARRSAALRILTDSTDEGAVRAVHDALMEEDLGIACRAASYGIHFRQDDAARLESLATKCDGAPVIRLTAGLVKQGKAGQIVQAGATCDDLRNVVPLVLRIRTT